LWFCISFLFFLIFFFLYRFYFFVLFFFFFFFLNFFLCFNVVYFFLICFAAAVTVRYESCTIQRRCSLQKNFTHFSLIITILCNNVDGEKK